MENFVIFRKFIVFFAKIGEKFRKLYKYTFLRGWGAEPQEASEFMKKVVEKSRETSTFRKF